MHKFLLLVLVAGTFVFAGACFGSETGRAGEGAHVEFAYGHPGVGSGSTRVIHIEALDDLRFRPSRVRVAPGTTVKFVVTNMGRLEHEFVLGDAAVQATHAREMRAMPGMPMSPDANAVALPPGQTRTLVWTFTRAGTVEYACHVPGHFKAGMVGQIFIEPPAAH